MATKKRARSTKKSIQHQPLHTHILASLFSTSHHKHSGKKIQSKHTSYGFMLALLMLTGILLFANLGALKAFGVTQAGSVNVSVNVLGEPPTQGAEIIYPQTNTQTSSSFLEVSGTCPDQTLVSIYNNGDFVGSTMCTTSNTFAIVITLSAGYNILQAQNYDALNQPGPTTAQHIIFYEVPIEIIPTEKPVVKAPQSLAPIESPPSPEPTAPQPSANPCYETLAKQSRVTSGSRTPVISVGCIHRNMFAGEKFEISFLVNGGKSPYAVNIDWKDGNNELKSITSNEQQDAEHVYTKAGTYEVVIYTSDAAGNKSQTQTVVTVNGDPAGVAAPTNTIFKNLQMLWVEAPVPLYIAVVALALGFWIGDIFQRFSASTQTIAKSKKRHA